jgi:uncharacterized protein (DUF433 family)
VTASDKTAKQSRHDSLSNQVRPDDHVFGKPAIRGTKITVQHILRCPAAGEAADDVVANYPPLTVEDIRAALAFAADHIEQTFAAE